MMSISISLSLMVLSITKCKLITCNIAVIIEEEESSYMYVFLFSRFMDAYMYLCYLWFSLNHQNWINKSLDLSYVVSTINGIYYR